MKKEIMQNTNVKTPEAMQTSEQQELIKKLSQKMNEQREGVIKLALSKHGIILDVREESKSRFKKVICEIKDGKETYFYNNGTPSGLRIVTIQMVSKQEDGGLQYYLKHY